MFFKKINDLTMATDIKKLYENSFPEEERTDFYGLFSDIYKDFSLYGLYENNKLLAFMHFNETKNFIHINYFAVDKSIQSKGIGSQCLDWLKSNFQNKALVLDVELPEKSAINNVDRQRRINFYNKNQFKFSEYTFNWAGSLMSPMYYGDLDIKEFIDYIQIIAPTITNVESKNYSKDLII